MAASTSGQSATFLKKNLKKNFRKRRKSSSDSDNEADDHGEGENFDLQTTLDEAKEMQKFRKRAAGVSADLLATGKAPSTEVKQEKTADPFKLQIGGIVDKKYVKNAAEANATEDDIVNLKATFSTETGRRDEDVDMLKYVDEKMAEVRGDDLQSLEQCKQGSVKDDVWTQVPEKYRVALSKKTEETISNQMLSGIPEVDLGIEAKISNIEATEQAKANIIAKRLSATKKQTSQFVPVNMAVNFVQHSRWKDLAVEDPFINQTKRDVQKVKEVPIVVPVVGGEELIVAEKSSKSKTKTTATDDYHYEKFKKQVLRR